MTIVDYVRVFTDVMAAQAAAVCEKLGTGVEEGSASLGAKMNVQMVMDMTDPEMVDALLKYFLRGLEKKKSDPAAFMLFESEVKGLSFYIKGFDPFLSANGLRVAPEFATIHERTTGVKLSPANVFSPEIPDMGSFVASGPDAGVFTDGAAIDTSKYAPARLKVETLSEIGLEDVVAAFSLKKSDGTTEPKTVTIPAGTEAGIEFDIGAETDKYADVLGITVAGGTAGDSFKVKAPRERALPVITIGMT
jgi:hypothetical protein